MAAAASGETSNFTWLAPAGRAGAGRLCSDSRGTELAAQADEQRLERERRRDLELLGFPPGCADELAGLLGSVHSLAGGVSPQLLEPVDVDGCRLGACGDDHEVAIPRLELLEQRKQLLALGAALGAPNALLRLPSLQLEGLHLQLGRLLRLRASLGDTGEESFGGVGRLERRVGIDRPRNGDQRLAACGCSGVEQLKRPTQSPTRDPRERRQ